MSPRRYAAPALLGVLSSVLLGLLAASPAAAAPVLGFQENWPGTSLQNWSGGGGSGLVLDNPGTGGADGAGDGYLRVTLSSNGRFGTRSTGPEYVGDWTAAGIQRLRFCLNDVGAQDAFEIHVSVGNVTNLWQYNMGFVPPHDTWQSFDVDLTNPASFTQIIGSDTFAHALESVDRILIRHDVAPFGQTPDNTHGDLGIDRMTLTDTASAASRTTWGRIKALYR